MTDEQLIEIEEDKLKELLEGKDLESIKDNAKELLDVLLAERHDTQALLAKFNMAVLLNSGLCSAAEAVADARVPRPKEKDDVRRPTFLVTKEPFVALIEYLHSAGTDFQEIILGDIHIPMREVIDAHKYIMEQRAIAGVEMVRTANKERDAIFQRMGFLLTQLVKCHGLESTEGFEHTMKEAKQFIEQMESAQKSGQEVAKENIDSHKKECKNDCDCDGDCKDEG